MKGFEKNAWKGGPYEDSAAVVRKSNSSRPQNYTGKYVTDIPGALSRPSDDGAEHPGIVPKQGFRKDLPDPKRSGDPILDGTYDADMPSHDSVQKKWR